MTTAENAPQFIESEELDGRERILRAAYGLFVESGYRSVSMQQIAEASGIQKATLYHHFRSKEDLFVAIVRSVNQHTADDVAAVIAEGGSAEEQLVKMAAQSFRRSQSHYSRLLTDIQENLDPERRKEILKEQAFPSDLLEEIVRTGIANGELPDVDVSLVISMYSGLIWGQIWMKKIGRDGRTLDDELARTLIHTLFAGLRCANA